MNDGLVKVNIKKHGVYYTPSEIAQVMSDWAIRSPNDLILEPSFGGCHFLDGSIKRLVDLGSKAPDKQLFGCDIDPIAFTYLDKLLSPKNSSNFVQSDFLNLRLASFGIPGGFDVVIGNPPYVSHHNLSPGQYEEAQKTLEQFDYSLKGKASLWAYFVLHSLNFMKSGGRMAWILPSSFLYADYSNQVKDILKRRFIKCLIIQIGERLFISDGTEEISVIVICNNYDKNSDKDGIQNIVFIEKANQVEKTIENWEAGKLENNLYDSNASLSLLDNKPENSYFEISSKDTAFMLGEFFDIQIGIVSGANRFFIITDEKAKANNLPKNSLEHILTKFRYANGLIVTNQGLKEIRNSGKPCLLVDTSKAERDDKNLNAYINSFPEEEKNNNTTFARRKLAGKPWHEFNDGRIPDAFFPYMLRDGPQIIINQAKVNSTNSIHRLFSHEFVSQTQVKAVAISILSTFSQLSAEIEGRIYGAGVLKHEPSEAGRIKILLPALIEADEVDRVFNQVHSEMISNGHNSARQLADNFVMKDFSASERRKHINILFEAVQKARTRRLPSGGN